MSAWFQIPAWEIALCIALIAAVIVGLVGVVRDIRRDIEDPP